MKTKVKKTPVKTVKYNQLDDVCASLSIGDFHKVVQALIDSEISFGTNSYTMISSAWFLDSIIFEVIEGDIVREEIVKAITAPFINVEAI
jgi:hypothetical protein